MKRCNICGGYLSYWGLCTNCSCPEYASDIIREAEKEAEEEADRQFFMQKHGLGDRDMINNNKPTDI